MSDMRWVEIDASDAPALTPAPLQAADRVAAAG
jgi:hypothetical protein